MWGLLSSWGLPQSGAFGVAGGLQGLRSQGLPRAGLLSTQQYTQYNKKKRKNFHIVGSPQGLHYLRVIIIILLYITKWRRKRFHVVGSQSCWGLPGSTFMAMKECRAFMASLRPQPEKANSSPFWSTFTHLPPVVLVHALCICIGALYHVSYIHSMCTIVCTCMLVSCAHVQRVCIYVCCTWFLSFDVLSCY